MIPVCPMSTKLDEDIAKFLGNSKMFSTEQVSRLRTIWDFDDSINYSRKSDAFVQKENESYEKFIERASKNIKKFKQYLYRRDKSKRENVVKNFSKFKELLHKDFKAETPLYHRAITNRASAIVYEVSAILDSLSARFPNITRNELMNGVTINGNRVGGIDYLLDVARGNVLKRYMSEKSRLSNTLDTYYLTEEGFNVDNLSTIDISLLEENGFELNTILDIERAKLICQKYENWLNHWNTLSVYACKLLSAKERYKIKLNAQKKLEKITDIELSQEFESQDYDPEEESRNGYMQSKDKISPLATMTPEIFSLCSNIPMTDKEGNKYTDDLGYNRTYSVELIRKTLNNYLSGVQSAEDVYDILELNYDKNKIIAAVVDKISTLNWKSAEDIYGKLFIQFSNNTEKAYIFNSKNGKMTKTNANTTFNMLAKAWLSNLTNKFKGLSKEGFFRRNSDNNGSFSKEGLTSLYDLYNNWIIGGSKKVPSKTGDGFDIVPLIRPIFREKNDKEEVIPVADRVQKLCNFFTILTGDEALMNIELASLLLTTVEGKAKLGKILAQAEEIVNGLTKYITEGVTDISKFVHTSTKDGKTYVTFDEGIDSAIMKSESISTGKKPNIFDFINYELSSNQGHTLNKKFTNIINLIESFNPSTNIESYSYIDKHGKKTRYYNNIASSYLYSLEEELKYLMGKQDVDAYLSWLNYNFLDNPLLCKKLDNGKYEFYNDVVKNLYDAAVPNTGIPNKDRFMDSCLNPKSFINNFSFGKNLGYTDKKFPDCSDIEHLQMTLIDFLSTHRSIYGNGISEFSTVPMFILGDANCYKSMVGITYGNLNNYDNTIKIAVEKLSRVFKSELEKFRLVDQLNNIGYDINNFQKVFNKSKRTFEFTELPFLNNSFENGKYAIPSEDSETILNWFDSSTSTADKEAVISNVERLCKIYLEDRVQFYIDDFVNKGILYKNTDKNTGEVTYSVSKQFEGIFKEALGAQKSPGNEDIKGIVTSFYINVKLNLIDQVGMLDGGTAFYKGVKELQKRNKQLHASGKRLDLNATWNNIPVLGNNKAEKCIYFKDPKHNIELYNSPLYSRLRKVALEKFKNIENEELRKKKIDKFLKDFREATVTDGQAYRTLSSYRKLLIMSHQWTNDLETNYNKIKAIKEKAKSENRNITDEEFNTLADLAVSFKPIKPFTYAFETIKINSTGELVKVPVQHKYAEAVLIPELLPEGSKLRAMAEWADEDINGESRCDLMLSEECVKVGMFNPVDISRYKYNEATKNYDIDHITNKEQLINALNTAYIHNIPYKGYRIQTNTPDHMYESTLFGTQARKMWYNGIDRTGTRDYSNYVNGATITLADGTKSTMKSGEDLIKFYNQLICANIIDDFKRVESLFTGKDSKQKLAKILLEGVFANNRTTIDALENFTLTGDDKFILPLFAPTLSKEVQGSLLSMFKKAVNKQKIAGGSAVQVSPMGSISYDDSGDLKFVTDPSSDNNILYGECEIPFDLQFSAFNGKSYRLSFGEYCYRDGTLKEGKILGKWENLSAEDKKKYALYQSYVNKNGEVYIPKIEQDFPGILDIVAKRIPTERNYSMLRMRVKRFVPMASGATIKVPAEGCVIAGFDFDIDKLYLMRKEFRAKKLSEEELEELWDKFYEEYPDIYRKLKAAQEKSNIENLRDIGELGTKLLAALNNKDKDSSNEDARDEEENNDRLYKLWNEADLEGSYATVFNDFLNKYLKDFLIVQNRFDNYDTNKLPQTKYELNKETGRYENIGNSAVARNNMLFELFCKRLEDEETMTSRFTPGGFFNASTAALGIRKLLYSNNTYNSAEELINAAEALKENKQDPEPKRDYSEIETIIYYNKQNQIADKLIGVMANHNITHAFLNTFDECKLITPIAIGTHAKDGLSDLIQRDNHDLRMKSELMIAELLAASVDAVKDPVLNYLNINNYTANIAAMLARLGYDMMDIGLFLNQPIIHKYIEECNRDPRSADTVLQNMLNKILTKSNRIDITKMTDYSNKLDDKALINGIKAGSTSTDQQAAVLQVFGKLRSQASNLSDITTATKMSASNSVGPTIAFFEAQKLNIDTVNERFNSESSEIVIKKSENNQDLLRNDLDITSKDYFNNIMNSSSALEQCFYDSSKGIIKVMKSIFPYADPNKGYYKTCLVVKDALFNGDISESIINYINQDYLTYMMEQQNGSMFNSETEINNLAETLDKNSLVKAKEYFTKHFVSDFINFRNQFNEGEWELLCLNYPILDYIKTSASSILNNSDTRDGKFNKNTPHKRIYLSGISRLEDYEKQAIADSWGDMFSTDVMIFPDTNRGNSLNELCNKVFPNLGKYLIYYSHYIAGNTYTPSSFIYSASTEVLKHIDTIPGKETYIEYLNKILDSDIVDGIYNISPEQIPRFIQYFIQNHTDFYQLVRTIEDPTRRKGLKNLVMTNHKYRDSFEVSLSDLKSLDSSENNPSIGNTTGLFMKVIEPANSETDNIGRVKYIPAIVVGKDTNKALYVADMTSKPTGEVGYECSTEDIITYRKVPILGITDNYSQYSPEVADQGDLKIDTNEAIQSTDSIVEQLDRYVEKFRLDNTDIDVDKAISIVSKEVVDLLSNSTKYENLFYISNMKGQLEDDKENLRNFLSTLLTPDVKGVQLSQFLNDLSTRLKDFESNIVEKYAIKNGTLDENGNPIKLCNN